MTTKDQNFKNKENIVNISMKAAELLAAGKIDIEAEGHMGLTNTIINLAGRFEAEYASVDFNDVDAPDYWETIDRFAEEHLLQAYAVEETPCGTAA